VCVRACVCVCVVQDDSAGASRAEERKVLVDYPSGDAAAAADGSSALLHTLGWSGAVPHHGAAGHRGGA